EHALARDLVAGGVYVPGYTIAINEDCELVLRGATEELRVAARVVYSDGNGVGLQLENCDSALRLRIAALAGASAEPAPAAQPPTYEFHFDEAAEPAPAGQAPRYEFHFDDDPAGGVATDPAADG